MQLSCNNIFEKIICLRNYLLAKWLCVEAARMTLFKTTLSLCQCCLSPSRISPKTPLFRCGFVGADKGFRMVPGIQKLIADTPLLIFFAVFMTGALTSLSSSTIVRVPVALGFIAGATESKKKALFVTFLFIFGLVISCTVLGLFLGMVGRVAFTIIQCNKYIFYLLGFLLFVFGLFIAGLLKIKRLPSVLQFRESLKHATFFRAFFFGTLFALIEMPTCPASAGLLLMLASLVVTHNLAQYSVLIFVSFALGQSLPVLAVALSANLVKTDIIMFLVMKIRRIEDRIEFFAGNMLITLGIYYLVIA
jgi:cytochrome c biogenesis protein CcdA